MEEKHSVGARRVLHKILLFLNRISHFIDIPIIMLLADYVYKNFDWDYIFLIYIVPIYIIYKIIKWEFRVIKSNRIIRETKQNKRVQAFSGGQGAGKTSFMLHCLSVTKSNSVYTNFPCKLHGKFTKQLDNKVLDVYEQVPYNSQLALDEATMLYHNLMCDVKDNTEKNKLFGQALHQQLIRHFYDGNLMYSSVDITRLPQVLKDNIGMTNFMLGQGSESLSLITAPFISFVGKLLGFNIRGAIRYWDVQQLERIPEGGYTFDLSTQEKDTNTNHFANLVRFCGFNSASAFEYDDRFMRGIYETLPKHIDELWKQLEFEENDLRKIGYGKIIDFFKHRTKNI